MLPATLNIKKEMMTKKKKSSEEPVKEEADENPQILLLNSPNDQSITEKLRTLNLYGEIDETTAGELCFSLLALMELGYREDPTDPEDPESETVASYDPVKLIISTHGGSASEMFSIYDTMRIVREQCDIQTLGLGKVMSAGVLLLAAGTKGQRAIGKNCRVMMHSVIGASYGSIHNLENEMEEIRWMQDRHVECLIEETNMTKRQIKKMLSKKMNIYLTAEEAVKLGIADKIV